MELLLSLLSSVGYWLQVILSFGMLVVAHEFGHFIVAKWTGCRVDEFAVGFGPAIWQYQPKNSETLYALRWVPLGGYNRIWGYEDVSSPDFFDGVSEEEQKRAFVNRPIWARALVLVAGSTFNFGLAILMVAVWGLTAGFPYTEVEDVVANSPAQKAGLKAGDSVRNFGFFSRREDISAMIASVSGKAKTPAEVKNVTVRLEVTSPGQAPRVVTMHPEWNDEAEKPMIGIIMREALTTTLGAVRPDSPYSHAGLKKGDQIASVDGTKVTSGLDLVKLLEERPREEAIVEYRRDGKLEKTTIKNYRMWALGVALFPKTTTNEMRVAGVAPDSAAYTAGLRTDDIITHINGKPVTRKSADWEELVKLEKLPPLHLSVVSVAERTAKGDQAVSRDLLISPSMVDRMVEPLVLNQRFVRVGPVAAFREGILQTGAGTKLIIDSLASLFKGKGRVQDLSGPIGIFSTSYQMAKSGLYDLMYLMFLLTVNLGIFNLLPFPALDGGRMVFLGLEAIFRRPVVDIRMENMIHIGGFLLLLGFMLFVSIFDIGRLLPGG